MEAVDKEGSYKRVNEYNITPSGFTEASGIAL
jgi:hypothetical protein